jgi:hypothetical protein
MEKEGVKHKGLLNFFKPSTSIEHQAHVKRETEKKRDQMEDDIHNAKVFKLKKAGVAQVGATL